MLCGGKTLQLLFVALLAMQYYFLRAPSPTVRMPSSHRRARLFRFGGWSFVVAAAAAAVVAAIAGVLPRPLSVRAERILTQIHVVTRHGSRMPLTKHAVRVHEEGVGATVTPLGQRQMYDLGLWIKERYGGGDENNNDNGTDSFFDEYDPSRVRLQSSSFDRTIVSANSLALGLFDPASRRRSSSSGAALESPWGSSAATNSGNGNDTFHTSDFFALPVIAPANIPVYTEAVRNDVTIRAYDKCPLGLGLEELYESRSWKELQRNHTALLRKLASIPEFDEYVDVSEDWSRFVPLREIWNVFDAMYVARTECGKSSGSSSGATPPFCAEVDGESAPLLLDEAEGGALTDAEWRELQALVHDVEYQKYGDSRRIGTLVGGNLLGEIVDRMMTQGGGTNEGSETTTTTATGLQKFYLYSAHYPTLLGIFAALKDDYPMSSAPPIDSPWQTTFETIPNYASALIFELHQDTASGEKIVEIVYRSGPDATRSLDSESAPDVQRRQGDVVSLGRTCRLFSAPPQSSDDSDDACLLETLSSFLAPSSLSVEGTDSRIEFWCRACGSNDADVCMRQAATSTSTGNKTSFAFGFLAGIALSAFFAVLSVIMLYRQTRRASPRSTIAANDTDNDADTKKVSTISSIDIDRGTFS